MIFPSLPPVGLCADAGTAAWGEGAGQSVISWSTSTGPASRPRSLGSLTGCRPCTTRPDQKVFDKVVVVTDRLVLDRQLQETIYQLEHAHGVVERIDRDSSQLAAALTGEQARIIITTLQKFPFLLDKVGQPSPVAMRSSSTRRTSQTGRQPRSCAGCSEWPPVRMVTLHQTRRGRVSRCGRRPRTTAQPQLLRLHRDTQGQDAPAVRPPNPDTGSTSRPTCTRCVRPSRRASSTMCWPTTPPTTFWRIEKTITEDPAFETAKARRAIARFVTLHEHNLAQRAEVVVEQFRQRVAHKIGGRAKAMVVTSSRAHAVRFTGRCVATSTTRAMTSGCWSPSPGPSATTATT